MSNRMKLKLVAPPDRDRRQDLVRRKRHDRYARILKGVIALPVLAVGVILVQTVFLAKKPFYVYSDKGAQGNHYIPSGWMGNFGDIKLEIGNAEEPVTGTAIKITYTNANTQGAGWAGLYWQDPPQNWGDREGGYDLSKYKRLTFLIRGAKGGEIIRELGVGGITGEHGDSDEARIGPITLTSDWKKYSVDLRHKNLAHIVGGFVASWANDDNPNGMTFYVDEIRYE